MRAGGPLTATSTRLDEVLRLVAREMKQVEEEFRKNAGSTIGTVTEISRYLQQAGGKRVRPAVLLLASKMVGYEGAAAIRLGSVVEMIHTATLVHDDIIDDAATRRGRSSVNSCWGNQVTVLFGDWLYMTSFQVALAERNFKVLDALIDVTRKMVEGELIQLQLNGHSDVTEAQHMEVALRKTAFLFSVCARLGAVLGRVPQEHEEALARYGLNLGIAFQLVDDILDFTSSEAVLGKPVLSDLREGKVTLPLIYLLQNGQPEQQRVIETVLMERDFRSVTREQILGLVADGGTLERARLRATRYAEEARSSLAAFQPSVYREALQAIPDLIINRES